MSQTLLIDANDEVEVERTNRLPMPDEEARRIGRSNAIVPPYPPEWLDIIFRQSSALRPAIEALEANVDGHGHRFEAVLDISSEAFREIVSDSILYERIEQLGGARHDQSTSLLPSEMDVSLRIAEIDVRMRFEKMRLEALYSACTPGSSFIALRKQLRRDLEVTGNAYLGIRRDNRGNVAEFEYLPSIAMRIRPVVCDAYGRPLHVQVRIPVRATPITIEHVTTYRTFRTFVQWGIAREVYFKEFGDPRCYSATTGNLVDSVDDLRPGDMPATEVVHLKVHSAAYEYGVPRWIGAAPSAVGLRASQEVNASHFDNNAIPRMFILIAGGTLVAGAEEKIRTLLRAHAKGRENYGSCVIVQATPAANNPNARVTIEIKPMKEAVPDDGLFLKYGAASRDEVLSQFRLPKFAVGMLQDVNRSTAREGMEFVEDQVYQPMRTEFDAVMKSIHEAEGYHYWKFVSNSPVSRDPETASKIVDVLARAGGQTINEVRRSAAEIQNTTFKPIREDWADMPLELAKLVFRGGAPAQTDGESFKSDASIAKSSPQQISSPDELVQWLVDVRDAFARGESINYAAETRTAKGTTLVIPMTGEKLSELVEFD